MDLDKDIKDTYERGDWRGAIAMTEHVLRDLIILRMVSAEALGKIKAESAIDTLIEIMRNDPEQDVRYEASKSLEMIGTSYTLEVVKSWRSEPNDKHGYSIG